MQRVCVLSYRVFVSLMSSKIVSQANDPTACLLACSAEK